MTIGFLFLHLLQTGRILESNNYAERSTDHFTRS